MSDREFGGECVLFFNASSPSRGCCFGIGHFGGANFAGYFYFGGHLGKSSEYASH
jgi:hypothetical protein